MTFESQREVLNFQAEVQQLLRLVAHSLYSNKEVFLRELISNASDACDKLRFEALTDNNLYENDTDLKIKIRFSKDNNTIVISDNGIGMNRQEIIDNIGTIARSGTQQFLRNLTNDQIRDTHLIGQFGVGFYSSFIVADKVTLITRRAGLKVEQGVLWESNGEGEYILENVEKLSRGTEITLHLRQEESDFLNDWRLKSIIKKYSDHITFPVLLTVSQQPSQDEPDKLPQFVEERVNQALALWVRPKQDISDEEYKEFYKYISHDNEDPIAWVHNKVEGTLEYTALCFIPARAPFNLWEREQHHGVRLYVQRVFVAEDTERLMPHYLRFIRGIIDSNDLPLNISREILQNSKLIDSMRSGTTKKILNLLEEVAKDNEKYTKLWQAFGKVIKEGPAEDYNNREQIARLLRFSSTYYDSAIQNVSLVDYISRMQENQEKIFFITAESFTAAKNSPHLEIFRKKGLEVLLLSDRVDEWLMSHLTEFNGKSLQSVTKGTLDIDQINSEFDKNSLVHQQEEYKELLAKFKSVLGDKIQEVRLSKRLIDSPACLVVDEHAMSAHLERMLRDAGQNIPISKPYLELNTNHPLVKQLNKNDNFFKEWVNLLFEQAVLAEGGQLEDPASFVKNLNSLLINFKTQVSS